MVTAVGNPETGILAGDQGSSTVRARREHEQILAKMQTVRSEWFSHWRQISEVFLPRRYPTLSSASERRTADRRNKKLLSSVSTRALRVLANGLQDGITSPARQWFRLRLAGFSEEELSQAAKVWLEEVTARIRTVLAESNFYDSLSILYLDWCAFGTACMDIRPDFEEVVRFYNYGPGEFFLTQNAERRVNRAARRITMTVEQMVQEFGIENVRELVQQQYRTGGAALLTLHEVNHIVEQNADDGLLRGNSRYREVYWDSGDTGGRYLAVRPLSSWSIVSPRWEVVGEDVYGVSPAMDAYADVKQLQEMIKQRNIGLSKLIRPPIIADQQLRNRPTAFSTGGVTYASGVNSNFGAKPLFQIQLPLNEMTREEQNLAISIQETLYNHLFAGISQLDSVRSATEIVARDQERLVQLGPVLGRFENEGLDVILTRVFDIMDRAGLFPEPPAELAEMDIDVQYVSILSDAQRAVGTASTERFLQFTAELAGVYPEVRRVPNAPELLRDYAERTGVPATGINSREAVAQAMQQDAQNEQAQQNAQLGATLAQGAQTLSQTEVGGGINALQALGA